MRQGIFVLNWSPYQGGSYRQTVPSLHPQRPAVRHWQHPSLRQAPPPAPQTQGLRRNQEAEQNPQPTPQIQIGPGFRIRAAIDEAEANGVNIPLTEDSFHFLLSYHLKGVCNTHFGGWNFHRPLSQSEFGWLVEQRECFCGGNEAPPVLEVDTGVLRQVSTLSS